MALGAVIPEKVPKPNETLLGERAQVKERKTQNSDQRNVYVKK